MAGVKQFDPNEALDRAMTAFWSRGYEATSIDDLVEATGIGRGSLYGTFGDKRQLFITALDHYWNTVAAQMIAELSDPDGRCAIERMFDVLIRRASDPAVPRGCLITNTALECPTRESSCSPQAARRKIRMFRVSCRSAMNFARESLFEEPKRNSGSVWRKAFVTTNSDGGMPGRVVLSQVPDEFQTSLGKPTARY
jgi:AcrR family transcriptional regulator